MRHLLARSAGVLLTLLAYFVTRFRMLVHVPYRAFSIALILWVLLAGSMMTIAGNDASHAGLDIIFLFAVCAHSGALGFFPSVIANSLVTAVFLAISTIARSWYSDPNGGI